MKIFKKNYQLFIKIIASFFTLVVLIGTYATFFLASPLRTQAAEITTFVPFGGWVVSYVPPLVPPAPPCPGHVVIRNANSISLTPLFGIYIPPFMDMLLYDYRNLYIPNTPVIGGYALVPFVTCPVPYPVFPIFFDGLFFLTGSGLGPSL